MIPQRELIKDNEHSGEDCAHRVQGQQDDASGSPLSVINPREKWGLFHLPEQYHPKEFSVIREVFCTMLPNTGTMGHTWS